MHTYPTTCVCYWGRGKGKIQIGYIPCEHLVYDIYDHPLSLHLNLSDCIHYPPSTPTSPLVTNSYYHTSVQHLVKSEYIYPPPSQKKKARQAIPQRGRNRMQQLEKKKKKKNQQQQTINFPILEALSARTQAVGSLCHQLGSCTARGGVE